MKQLCMQDTVSILTVKCLTVMRKLFQDREKGNKLQDTSHKQLWLRLRNCDYDTKSSTDTVRNNESDQVVDLIFEPWIIHAREVTYKRSRTIGG
jgi:hypothetical protein